MVEKLFKSLFYSILHRFCRYWKTVSKNIDKISVTYCTTICYLC